MKEMPEQNLEPEKEYTMEDFLAEMRGFKRRQEEKHISQDLAETEVDVLTEEDMRMWRTLDGWKKNPLSSEEMRNVLDAYGQGFLDEEGRRREDISEGRRAFLRFVRNEAQVPIVRKQMEELKEER